MCQNDGLPMKPTISWKNRIGVKLSGLIALVILLTLFPLAYVVSTSVNSFGTYSATVNRAQIRQLAIAYLTRLSREKGSKYEEYLERVENLVTLLAVRGSEIYAGTGGREIEPAALPPLLYQPGNAMFVTPPEIPILTVYWGGDELTADVTNELRVLAQLNTLMMKIKTLLPRTLAVHVITTSGIGRYYTWDMQAKEVAANLPLASEFDLRNGAPVTIFTEEKRSVERALWSSVYKDDVIDGLMVTATGAMVDEHGQVRAVTGVDMSIETIVEDILLNQESRKDGGAPVLFSFLIDSSGQLIAFPQKFMGTFGLDIDFGGFKNSKDLLRYNLQDSSKAGVREIVPLLLETDNVIEGVLVDGEEYLCASQSLPSLGWRVVLVARETDMLSSVERTQVALNGTLAALKSNFLLCSLFIAIVALLLVFLAVRHFVGPLRTLAAVAQQVGAGNLTILSELHRNDELGLLGDQMNEMIGKLKQADAMKNKYSAKLEREIAMRTEDLEWKNQQLEKVVEELHAESIARRQATKAIKEGEEQLHSIMESSLAGLCIIQTDRFKYANAAMGDITGFSPDELVRGMGPEDIILPEYLSEISARSQDREEGRLLTPTAPYSIRCIRKDGTVFDALIAGATVNWQGQPSSVGTIVDISRIKKVEEKLRLNQTRLKASLEEKNVLLKEVYHRTKNNMLVIISMLALQKESVDDERIRVIFTEMENRIRAMAMVHENLYKSKNLTVVNLGDYLERMVRALVSTMTMDDRLTVTGRFEAVSISFDRAVPLGLIVNELVTNSIKHGYAANESGEIRVEIREDGPFLELVVADKGAGLPEGFDVRKSLSFGLQITSNMIEKQLHGSYTVNRKDGTEFIITFPR